VPDTVLLDPPISKSLNVKGSLTADTKAESSQLENPIQELLYRTMPAFALITVNEQTTIATVK